MGGGGDGKLAKTDRIPLEDLLDVIEKTLHTYQRAETLKAFQEWKQQILQDADKAKRLDEFIETMNDKAWASEIQLSYIREKLQKIRDGAKE